MVRQQQQLKRLLLPQQPLRLSRHQQPQQQRRSARLRDRAARRVLPEATEAIVAQVREAHERSRPFPFLRLPGELRNLVYEWMVQDQNEKTGAQALHEKRPAALPHLARANQQLRNEYLTVFFRRRTFEVHVYCDLGAWRSLHRISLVASFLGSLDEAIGAVPHSDIMLAQARYYGCIKEPAPSGSLPTLWRSLRLSDDDDDDDDDTNGAAGGPRFANLVLVVGVWPEQPVRGAVAHTPHAVDFWWATLSRSPGTGRPRLAHRGRPAMPAYENGIFGRLAQDARDTADGLAERQTRDGGTFQGWSEGDILEICGRFRFWRNHRGPKEFADHGYGYEDPEDEGSWQDMGDSDSDSDDDAA